MRVWEVLRSKHGQSTVEFAIVFSLIVIICAGVAAIGKSLGAGVFIDHAIAASSHNLTNALGGIFDVFLY